MGVVVCSVNILLGVVIVLALLVLLSGFGLIGLLNTPITGGHFNP